VIARTTNGRNCLVKVVVYPLSIAYIFMPTVFNQQKQCSGKKSGKVGKRVIQKLSSLIMYITLHSVHDKLGLSSEAAIHRGSSHSKYVTTKAPNRVLFILCTANSL